MNVDLLRRTAAFIAAETMPFEMSVWYSISDGRTADEWVLKRAVRRGDWCGTAACIGGSALVLEHNNDPLAILEAASFYGLFHAVREALDLDERQADICLRQYWPAWAKDAGDDRMAAVALIYQLIKFPNVRVRMLPMPDGWNDQKR